MFGEKATGEKNNPSFKRMEKEMLEIFQSSYNAELVQLIQELHDRITKAEIDWEYGPACGHLEKLLTIAKYVAENTKVSKELTFKDSNSIHKIFEELNSLYDEVLVTNSRKSRYQTFDLGTRISCIEEVVRRNIVTMYDSDDEHLISHMVFRSYENLWKIVHRINTEWEELCLRNFSMHSIYYPFRDFFIYSMNAHKEMSEEEKYQTFMAILDGKRKFIPVYKHEFKLVALKPVSWDDERDEEVHEDVKKVTSAYRMRQIGEEVTQRK